MAYLRHRNLGEDRHDGRAVSCQGDNQHGIDHGSADPRIDLDFRARVLRMGLPHAWCDRVCRLDSSQTENFSLPEDARQEPPHQYPSSLALENGGAVCPVTACDHLDT